MSKASAYWDNVSLILDEVIDASIDCRERCEDALGNCKEARFYVERGDYQLNSTQSDDNKRVGTD